MSEQFESMSVIELRQKAKEMGVKLGAGINKQGIVAKLKEAAEQMGENTRQDENEEETETADAVQHFYAVDVSPLTGFIEKNIFNTNGKYAVIVASSKNPNDALYTLCDMFDLFTPEKE